MDTEDLVRKLSEVNNLCMNLQTEINELREEKTKREEKISKKELKKDVDYQEIVRGIMKKDELKKLAEKSEADSDDEEEPNKMKSDRLNGALMKNLTAKTKEKILPMKFDGEMDVWKRYKMNLKMRCRRLDIGYLMNKSKE